jgi:plastocyanin
MHDEIASVLTQDGIDRRGFLKCMAWAGTGLVFTIKGGVLGSHSLHDFLVGGTDGAAQKALAASSFSFVQISDSHIGFSKEANKDVLGTLKAAVDGINATNSSPDLLIHTGDLSHLSKPEEFDAMDGLLMGVRTGERFFVPGEHDVLEDDGKVYFERYGKQSKAGGWYSFDHKGVHFIALVNVLNLKAGGLGNLGEDQLAWLEKDVKGLSASTPIVVFAHVPLWTVYPEWGWGTDDGARAISLLKRFGSVTVLNGHIHQTMQKIEGSVTFHTARSTAFPQPKPGAAPSPGPMKVPADQLRSLLGVTSVSYAAGKHDLAIIDTSLAAAPSGAPLAATIDNFTFAPATIAVEKGTSIVWTNQDDIPHTVADIKGRFKSPVLDTGDKWEHTFTEIGVYDYFCTIHPHMTGKVVVH